MRLRRYRSPNELTFCTEDALGNEVELRVHFVPHRPPPFCTNPSSPLFSDCGDDGEAEILEAKYVSTGKPLTEYMLVRLPINKPDRLYAMAAKVAAQQEEDAEADRGDALYHAQRDREIDRRIEDRNGSN